MWPFDLPAKPNLKLGDPVPKPFLAGPVRLGPKQLAAHFHILGVSGVGKSFGLIAWFLNLLFQMAMTFIDPHSDSVNKILEVLAAKGYFQRPDAFEKLWYLEFREDDYFIPFNILKQKLPPHTIASNVVEAMYRAYPELRLGSAAFRSLIKNSIKVLVSNSLPITSLSQFLANADYRAKLLEKEDDPDVHTYFRNYEAMDTRNRDNESGSSKRRANDIVFNPVLKYSLGQQENIIDFDKILDAGITVLINLGSIHDIEARRLIGCLLTLGYETSAKGRENVSRSRTPHILILDEMHQFVAQSEEALSSFLSETRKYNVFTWLCHQTWSQASERLKGALQNCRTEIAFGIGYEDAQHTAKVMGKIDPEAVRAEAKTETQQDLLKDVTLQWTEQTLHLRDLPERNAMVKIRGQQPFQIVTPTVPQAKVDPNYIEWVKSEYRKRLTKRKDEIELVHQQPFSATGSMRFGPLKQTS